MVVRLEFQGLQYPSVTISYLDYSSLKDAFRRENLCLPDVV